MSKLGNLLKSTRLEQKKTLKDVVDATRIRDNFINMIEEGRFRDLPSYIHAYGFVKKYAEFLDLDYENLVWPLFSSECPKNGANVSQENNNKENNSKEDNKEASNRFEGNRQESTQQNIIKDNNKIEKPTSTTDTEFLDNSKNGRKTFAIILLVILLLAVGYGGYYVYTSGIADNIMPTKKNTYNALTPARVIEEAPAVTFEDVTFADDNESDNTSYFDYYDSSIYADNNTILAMDNNISSLSDNKTLFIDNTSTPITLYPKLVRVKFSENCWFKYYTDKGEISEITAIPGTELEIEFDKTFSLEIGNAIAVTLEYNGQEYSDFGNRGSVRMIGYQVVNGRLEVVR